MSTRDAGTAVSPAQGIVPGGCTLPSGIPSPGGLPGIPGLGGSGCFDPGPSLGAVLGGLGQQALQNLASQMLGQLLAVKDTNPMALAIAKHLASQFGQDILAAIQDPSEFLKKMDLLFNGVESSAKMRAAQAIRRDGPSFVFVNELPWAHIGDKVIMSNPTDEGPLWQGNPSVLVNLIPASGEDHIAVGIHQGTVAVPASISPNVFMGSLTSTIPSEQTPQGSSNESSGSNKESDSGHHADQNKRSDNEEGDPASAPSDEKPADSRSETTESADDTRGEPESTPDRKKPDKTIHKAGKELTKAAKQIEKQRAQGDLDARVEADTDELVGAKDRSARAHEAAESQRNIADAAEQNKRAVGSGGVNSPEDVADVQKATENAEAERYRESQLRKDAQQADGDVKKAEQKLGESTEAKDRGPETAKYKFLDKAGRVLGTASDLADLVSGDRERQVLVSKGRPREALVVTGKTVGKIAMGAGGALVAGVVVGATAPLWVAIGAGAGIGYVFSKIGEEGGALAGGAVADAGGIKMLHRTLECLGCSWCSIS